MSLERDNTGLDFAVAMQSRAGYLSLTLPTPVILTQE